MRNISTLLSNMLKCVREIQNCIYETINNEWELFENQLYKAINVRTIKDSYTLFLETITNFVDDASVVNYYIVVIIMILKPFISNICIFFYGI